ncbi:hypothetical protein BJY04DRAFT_42275 [Aspergillus karnatakaensis]|uniref:uncharacterized protein n=1 Tax=Aspergillus karnatakaensis TaxID=1810916 RepID=UPI003CCD9EE1
MHLPTLLPILLSAGLSTACTLGIRATHQQNVADGSNSIACDVRIWSGDLAEDGVRSTTPDASAKVECGADSHTLEYNGESYEFTWTSFGEDGGDVKIGDDGEITVQRTGGDLLSIYPDGESANGVEYSPVSTLAWANYWRRGINCP